MKNLFIGSMILASLFVGCDSSGGICCKGEGEQEREQTQVVYRSPVAVISSENNLTFNCLDSYDRDENNSSISQCDWNVTSYYNFEPYVEYNCSKFVENNNSVSVDFDCYRMGDNNVSIELTVTDDEGDKNNRKRFFSINIDEILY